MKTLKVILSIFVIFGLALLTSCNGFTKENAQTSVGNSKGTNTIEKDLPEKSIKLNMETEHFILYCSEKDKAGLQDLSKALESGYAKVLKDLNCELHDKITVKIYPDTETFHKAIHKPDAPWWYVGEGSGGVISIASDMAHVAPSNIVVHELTHIITTNNFGGLPEWLFQGIAMYEGKETHISKIQTVVRSGIIRQSIPSLNDLCVDYWRFTDNGGYEYSYTVVEFIIKEFGYDKLNQFLRAQYDYEKSFGLTRDDFYKQWVKYINENYK